MHGRTNAASAGCARAAQRFGSALNLNLHLHGAHPCAPCLWGNLRLCKSAVLPICHILLLDGVYATGNDGLYFMRVKAPTKAELETLVLRLSERIGRHLERQGLLIRAFDNAYLALEPHDDDGLAQVLGSPITYRIAIGPRTGNKAFTLHTLPARDDSTSARLAKAGGFSVHAGVVAEPSQRNKLERLARYVTRPAISEQRLSLTAQGHVRYELNTPYRDGTTHVFFGPLDFIARRAALIPKPRVNLIRFDEDALFLTLRATFGRPNLFRINLSRRIRTAQPASRCRHARPARAQNTRFDRA